MLSTLCSLAQEVPLRLAARALGATPLESDLRELCDGIGGRPTGSPASERAINWAAQKFREAGADTVRTESVDLPYLWLPVSAEASATAPERFSVRIAASPFTESTQGPIEAELVDAGKGTAVDFEKLGARAKGAIILVRSDEMKTLDDLFAEYLRNIPLYESARKAQVAAVLLESTRPRGLLYRHPFGMTSNVPMPAAIVSREHAERLLRLASQATVRLRLNIRNRTGGRFQSRNVIADIRGREKPEEIVLIGAHLDSWDLGTGSEDNGVNAVMVIDALRGFAAAHARPRRTVRFVLFTGEEYGMFGSEGYVNSHHAELDDHVAAVVFDSGSGRLSGFFLNGRDELRKPVNDALSVLAGFNANQHLPDGIDGTDNFDFALSGVPNLVGNQDPAPYLPDYHAESDTFERSNIREEKITEAVASTLLWSFAENPDRPALRQNRQQVEKLLKDTKLDEQMKALGQWEDFVNGKRGVSK